MRQAALFAAALSFSASAIAADRVSSRSIMDSCEFVYRVESDVRIEAGEETIESAPEGSVLYLRAQAANAWDREPALSEVFLVAADDTGLAAWTFESMSVSRGHLFRDLSFEWGTLSADDEFVPASERFSSDVGRRFGEACYTSRHEDALFTERDVSPVTNEAPEELSRKN